MQKNKNIKGKINMNKILLNFVLLLVITFFECLEEEMSKVTTFRNKVI